MRPCLRMSTSSQVSSTSRSRCEHRIRCRSAALANVADQPDHALARGRIETVGGLVEKQQPRAVRDGLRQLGELLHAERVLLQLAVARLAQADVEQRLVRAFERRLRKAARTAPPCSARSATALMPAIKESFSGM